MKFKLVEAAESKICCICKKPFDGYGNNAEPVCSGTCCDECNMKEVIPARLKMLDNSSSKDLDEAVLNETDESGNDEMDANCEDCGAVITISVDHDGPAYCANCMKNHLHEDLEDYKITYYLSTATAERRPETVEDVENDWKEEIFAADSDLDACKYAYEQIQLSYMDDFDFENVADFVEYCEMKDLGDGSPFIVKLEGPNGVIYDIGQTKEDFIEQVKENDEMLAYYRSALGIDESLNEGNSVSGKIPPALDSFLQDIAQMFGTIDYGDIMDHDYTEDDIRKLNNLRRRFITWSQYDEDDEEVKAKFNEIANKVAEILKRVDENINTINEKDANKMNEDMSVRAKLKALYPELNFDDEVTESFDDDMEFDIEESSEYNFMEALYKGSNLNDHDDEAFDADPTAEEEAMEVKDALKVLVDKFGNHSYKYELRGDEYRRYEVNPMYIREFKAPNDYIAMFAIQFHQAPTITNFEHYYYAYELLRYLNKFPTVEALKNYVIGDDAWMNDMEGHIFSLKNLTTGETLYESAEGYKEPEDDEYWENDLISDDYDDGM